MKKTLIAFGAMMVIGATALMAQPKFRVHGDIGFAQATGDFGGDDANLGFGIAVNARYAFSNKLDVGLEYEASFIVTATLDDADIDATGITGYQAKGYYHFLGGKFSPYVGLGVGFFSIETPEITADDGNGNQQVVVPGRSTTNFGFSPDFGLKIGKFVLGAKYTDAGEVPGGTINATYLRYYAGLTFTIGA